MKPYQRGSFLSFSLTVCNRGLKEHAEHPMKVFRLLQQNNLVVDRKRYNLAEESVEYFATLCYKKGVAEGRPLKVEPMMQWPAPSM